jgi:aryl-alcohol dehydrogenase-like predicted oxidoreductase
MADMEKRRLGRTDVMVSELCLGTMVFGQQADEPTAHRLMDHAVANGINFIDTAEKYPVPQTAQTYGRTEEVIGGWLKARGRRDDIILATKIAGRQSQLYVRPDMQVNGEVRIDKRNIEAAIDASLKRLQTEYVDLYQLHSPDRKIQAWGRTTFSDPGDADETPIVEQLEALDELVKAGKVRHIGLSNESGWGAMTFLQTAEQEGLPRVVSIQNSYSLLDRLLETDVAEVAHREDCGILAYSPLRHGLLSAKYVGGARPEGTRFFLFEDYFARLLTPNGAAATERYAALARQHGLEPAVMAIAYARMRPFVTSVIIGVRTMDQLEMDLKSASLELSDEVLEGIDAIHHEIANPCP